MKNRFVTLNWELIRDKNTTMHEKLILAEVNQLSMLEYGCVAKNNHFAILLGIKRQSVSRCINALAKKGYITINLDSQYRNFGRKITINKMFTPLNNLLLNGLTNCLQSKENITIKERKKIFKEKSHSLTILDPNELLNFIEYWTEHSEGGKKMRFEKETVFDNSKRQTTWKRRAVQFNPNNKETTIQIA